MTAHHGFDVWPAITAAVAGAMGQVVAAVGYVGANGHRHLPLKSGDVLVCDASMSTVRSGATNPTGLRRFVEAEVEVWSHQGLHAKVVALPRRAFVGSLNASDHSAYHLIEAMVETTDAASVQALRDFVLGLGEGTIDLETITELESYKPKRRPPNPRARRVAEIPKDIDKLFVLAFDSADWTTDEWEAHDNSRKSALARGRRRGGGGQTEAIAVSAWVYGRLHHDNWVIHQSESNTYSPGIVVAKSTSGDGHLLWLSRPPCKHRAVENEQSPGIPRASTLSALSARDARRAADLFR